MFGAPETPAIEAMFTTAPPDSAAIIARPATARTVIAPSRLTSTTRRASSSG
jgi:hypothetical protein